MWEREEFETLSPKRLSQLQSTGAVWPELTFEIAMELERRPHPHVACFFQLPYPVHVESEWHVVSILERDVRAHVRATLAWLSIDELGRSEVGPANAVVDEPRPLAGKRLVTQMIALVPVWGRRLDFYASYQACLADDGIKDRVIVPGPQSWVAGRPMRVAEFEYSICHRMPREILTMLRRFLPAYSILSLTGAPQPLWLSSFFVMSAPGRIIFNRFPEALVRRAIEPAAEVDHGAICSERLRGAINGPMRELTRFEDQLIAMNRLRKEGEAALALIGTLSLVEWFLTTQLPPLQDYDRQPSLSFILKKTRTLTFVDEDIRRTLLEAIEIRHRYTHGSPPIRQSATVAHGKPAGRERAESASELASIGERTIRAAFALYRAVNIERRMVTEGTSEEPA